jgi:hypothetical protein
MSAPFRVDVLESRRLLSGDVLAKVIGGKLLVLGDNQDNAVVIDDGGLASGQLRLTASGGTTINGSAEPVVLSGITRGIAVRLAEGDDSITLDGITAGAKSGVSINGSGGADTIRILNSAITGRTKIRAGGGDDVIELTGSTFADRFDLNTSGGRNSLLLGGAVFNDRKKIHTHKRKDTVSEGPAASALNFTFNFQNGAEGFQAGFADYPAGEEAFYELKSGVQQLPAEVGTGTGFYLSGNNHSDDLFMFVERALTAADGILPNQSYTVSFEITFASDAPTGCSGIGGAPGESVYLKAGATGTNPESVNVDGVMTLNVDKGQQSQGGTAASVAGDVANGIACEVAMQNETLPYGSVTRTHTHTATVKADANGNLYVIVGTDSGFEGTTNIYFQQIKVSLTPVSSSTPTKPGNGHGHSDGKSDGETDGDSDGMSDGDSDGDSDRGNDGDTDGSTDGDSDGDTDGSTDGHSDGASDGDTDGKSDADSDGDSDGDDDKDDKKERKDKKAKKEKKAKKLRHKK